MEEISQDRLEALFGESWKKLGYTPSLENPLSNVAEIIWERVKLNHSNDPGSMPLESILKQTIYQFCHFALHTDREVS